MTVVVEARRATVFLRTAEACSLAIWFVIERAKKHCVLVDKL
jgi:hypothetical protein